MKGQEQITAAIGTLILISAVLIVGIVVYGYVADTAPHDQVFANETMCTTCVNGSSASTLYRFDHIPVLNDSTMLCYNNSDLLMTHGLNDGTCLGYNIINTNDLNITNTSAGHYCQISDVVCTYTYDQAIANEQSFFDTNTANSYAGFVIATVIVIVLAAISIVFVVLLLKG